MLPKRKPSMVSVNSLCNTISETIGDCFLKDWIRLTCSPKQMRVVAGLMKAQQDKTGHASRVMARGAPQPRLYAVQRHIFILERAAGPYTVTRPLMFTI